MPVRPLRVIEIPTATERPIKVDDRKPPVAGSLGQADFRRIEQLLRFQDLVIAGKAAEIAASGNRDGIGKRRYFRLLLRFNGG